MLYYLVTNLLESITKSAKTIDNDHAYIHQGKFFETIDKQTLTASTSYVYSITTPASDDAYVHYRNGPISTSADKVTITLAEGATFTGGTTMSVYNHNRNSSNTASTVIKKGVAISASGTIIEQIYIGGGTGVGSNATGAEVGGASHEWVLKPSTNYALTIINNSSGDNIVNTSITFYEEDEG